LVCFSLFCCLVVGAFCYTYLNVNSLFDNSYISPVLKGSNHFIFWNSIA